MWVNICVPVYVRVCCYYSIVPCAVLRGLLMPLRGTKHRGDGGDGRAGERQKARQASRGGWEVGIQTQHKAAWVCGGKISYL